MGIRTFISCAVYTQSPACPTPKSAFPAKNSVYAIAVRSSNGLREISILVRHETNQRPLASCPSSPACPVEVLGHIERKIILDHQRDPWQVQAPRRHVGAHEHVRLA